ncbi:MAG: KilA-N domain-containing protein [Candidatus Kapaibacterium sp.]
MKKKYNNITVLDRAIAVTEDNYISLTDMLKAKDGEFFISDWLRNRNTLEYMGIWESINNPDFNYGEFATIKSQSGLNSFKISVKEWVNKTKAIGIMAKAGRYGGTYAHKDLAFEFGMWISAEFKIYLVIEFQRLKDQEFENLDWNVKRSLTKINYRLHTDSIKENLIPDNLSKLQTSKIYADEADVLNMALYGITARQWRIQNPNKAGNIRDYSNVTQLICLSNLENINSIFIKDGLIQSIRLERLNQIAIQQMNILTNNRNNISIKNEMSESDLEKPDTAKLKPNS